MITYGRHTNPPATPIDHYAGVEITFGNFCSIASGLTIISGQHPPVGNPLCVSQYPFKEEFGWDYPPSEFCGIVTVGNDVWIGQNVTILEGVTVGDGAIIGACSVVSKDIPPYAIVVGNPAEIKKYRFHFSIRTELLKIKWWEWTDEKIKERITSMKNVNLFLNNFDTC